jgi:hypothetical protein
MLGDLSKSNMVRIGPATRSNEPWPSGIGAGSMKPSPQHHFDEAAAQFAAYRDRSADAAPLLRSAEPWSLFVPAAHEAHYAALRRLADTASATPP